MPSRRKCFDESANVLSMQRTEAAVGSESIGGDLDHDSLRNSAQMHAKGQRIVAIEECLSGEELNAAIGVRQCELMYAKRPSTAGSTI